jgi:hypothetical protein
MRLLLALALLGTLTVAGPAEATEPGSSCGGIWYKGDARTGDGVCVFDLAGSPITVEGSWTIDPDFLAGHPNPSAVKTDIHVEVLVRAGRAPGAPDYSQTLAPGWDCEAEPQPYTVSCSATYSYGTDFALPAGAGPVVTLECHAHRHSPPSLPGSGEFRCGSGAGSD